MVEVIPVPGALNMSRVGNCHASSESHPEFIDGLQLSALPMKHQETKHGECKAHGGHAPSNGCFADPHFSPLAPFVALLPIETLASSSGFLPLGSESADFSLLDLFLGVFQQLLQFIG